MHTHKQAGNLHQSHAHYNIINMYLVSSLCCGLVCIEGFIFVGEGGGGLLFWGEIPGPPPP